MPLSPGGKLTMKVSLGISFSFIGTILKFLNSCTSPSLNSSSWNLRLALSSISSMKSNSSISCSSRKYSAGTSWLVSPDRPWNGRKKYWLQEAKKTWLLINILSQTYNATHKWVGFSMNMWCRTIFLRHIAQLLTRNLWYTVGKVSTSRFAGLISDWSKLLFGSQALAKRLQIANFSISLNTMLGQIGWRMLFENSLLQFHKI